MKFTKEEEALLNQRMPGRICTIDSSARATLRGLLANVEAAFSVLVLTADLALVLYVASLERPLELAGIVARGAGSRILMALLWGRSSSSL